MLALLGHASLDELARAAVPSSILLGSDLDLPEALPEIDVLAELRELGHRNRVMTTMIGLGYYGTHTPQVVLRKVLENPAWYTAYTPYQPEISQGRLEALLNYQTMICDLTGLPLANSSLLDEATAAAEAMTVARRVSKARSNRFVVDLDLFPQTLATLQTRAEPLGIEIVQADLAAGLPAGGCFGVLAQYPGASGLVRDLEPLAEAAHAEGALVCVAADLLALVLLKPPGEMGADVVVGTSQRFGVPIGFGGPHAAYMSVRSGLERALPGRLVGVSIDADGNPALRLALQTREQHIRREKATSNICTAQVLLAVMASMYAVYHGREGLELIAERVHRLTAILARGLRDGGLELVHDDFFDTIRVRVPHHADAVIAAARKRGINLLRVDADTVGISCDEVTERPQVEHLWHAFRVQGDIEVLDADTPGDSGGARAHERLPLAPGLQRAPLGDPDAALPAHALGPRRRARPLDDPARLLHDEAQRDDRDAGRLLARVLNDPPVRAARPGRRLRHPDRRPRALAVRDHGVRRRLAAAQRRLAGRVRRPARDPRLSSRSRRARARRLPDPVERARHQCGERRDGGHARRGRGVRRARQRRSGRSAGEALRARRAGRGADDHLPLDAWRLRAGGGGDLRARARRRRPGLRRRRQPQRARGSRSAGPVRCRRLAPEPAQDVLHPARRRRAGRRAGRGARPPAAVPAQPPAAAGGRAGKRPGAGFGRALGFGEHPADLVGLHPPDGARRPAAGDAGRDPQRQLHRAAPQRALPGALQRARAGSSRTSASSTCARSRRRPASPSRTSPSG